MTLPAGAAYLSNYINDAAARALAAHVDAAPWITELKRRVQHYGYRYNYRPRRIGAEDYLGPLPQWMAPLLARLVAGGWFASTPDQSTINEYIPGQGIAPHVDCLPCFGDTIASLSIGSGCEMTFRRPSTGARVDLYLEANSLLIMQGEARYDWTHGIAPRKSDLVNGARTAREKRMSLTFRAAHFAH